LTSNTSRFIIFADDERPNWRNNAHSAAAADQQILISLVLIAGVF
jgi:hypothetical protein